MCIRDSFMDNKPGLLDEFKKARELAEGKPFGVNISMLPHKDYSDCTVTVSYTHLDVYKRQYLS